jgi:hypothetical protein
MFGGSGDVCQSQAGCPDFVVGLNNEGVSDGNTRPPRATAVGAVLYWARWRCHSPDLAQASAGTAL